MATRKKLDLGEWESWAKYFVHDFLVLGGLRSDGIKHMLFGRVNRMRVSYAAKLICNLIVAQELTKAALDEIDELITELVGTEILLDKPFNGYDTVTMYPDAMHEALAEFCNRADLCWTNTNYTIDLINALAESNFGRALVAAQVLNISRVEK